MCELDESVKMCSFIGSSHGTPPSTSVVDGAQARTCAADETMKVEVSSV